MNRTIYYIPLFSLFLCCNEREKKVYYFPNEKKVEKEVEFKNGVQDGYELIYHHNGQIKSKSEFLNGKLNGRMQEYYANGNPRSVLSFYKGIQIDDALIYRDDGSLLEIQHYDSSGKMYDFERYLPDRSRDKKALAPIFWLNKDTFRVGDTLHFEARIGNITDHRLNRGLLLVGTNFTDTILDHAQLIDTIF